MSATITKTPPPIAWSLNPIEVEVTGSNYLAAAGAKAITRLTFTGAIGDGDSIAFSWNGVGETFVAKTAPDDSGTQFPAGAGDWAYVQMLVDWFAGNAYIAQDFLVSADNSGAHPRLVFTAINTGPLYNISPVTSGNMALSTATAGVLRATQANYAIHVEIWIANATATDFVNCYNSNLELDIPLTGKLSIDIGDLLHGFLKLDVPDPVNVNWQACQKSVRQYYLVVAEYYSTPVTALPVVRKITTSPKYTVAYGGYSLMALNSVTVTNHLQQYLMLNSTQYQVQKWFESYPLNDRYVRTNQPQYLYFVNNRAVTETLKLKIVMTLDTVAPITIYAAGASVATFKKFCIDCSYLSLGLNNYTTNTQKVLSYTVQVVEDATADPRSVIKNFILDRSAQQYTRFILFSDSAGNFKTLAMSGMSQASTDITDALSYKATDSATPKNGDFTRNNILATETDGISTGYMNYRDYDALQELLLAKQAFRVFGNALVPIVIKSNKIDKSADGRNLNAMKIEYQLAFQETVYTADTGYLPVLQLNVPQNSLNI